MANKIIRNEQDELQAQRQEEVSRKQAEADIRAVLSNPAGVRFIRSLLARGHIFQSHGCFGDALVAAEARRNFALQILNDVLEVAPERAAAILLNEKD